MNQVSAVTSLARNPKGISELSRILPQHRRSAIGKEQRNNSSTRQIDKLFQSQLKENSDGARKDFELHEAIEDISDEEFVEKVVEKVQNPCHKSAEVNNANKGNKDTGISNTTVSRGFPNSCLSEGNTLPPFLPPHPLTITLPYLHSPLSYIVARLVIVAGPAISSYPGTSLTPPSLLFPLPTSTYKPTPPPLQATGPACHCGWSRLSPLHILSLPSIHTPHLLLSYLGPAYHCGRSRPS